MRFLKLQHIPVIPLPQLARYLQGKDTIPDHAVVITIDDGYKTAVTKAWPILRRYGFPFTVFIYPQAISRHGSAMTWRDVNALVRAGVDVESHSMTHPLLTHPGVVMDADAYDAWLDEELAGSKKIIEQHTGVKATALAYPFGGYDEHVVEKTRAAGYLVALTCDDGNVWSHTDPWHVNRRLVYHRTRWRDFVDGIFGRPLWLANLTPGDGERVGHVPREIVARILNLQQILPDSLRILVDKLGRRWLPAKIDPTSGIVALPVSGKPKSGYYFVSLMARDRTHPESWREATWLFIVRRNASKN